MKRIIKRHTPPPSEVYVDNVYTDGNLNAHTITAYVTKSGNGLGVMIQSRVSNLYGFKYHSDLIQRRGPELRYSATTKLAALEKVLDAGRELIIFDNFTEFVQFAAGRTKL